ncbi:hypothetical protein CJ197_14660 [Brachybacterium sp. UMB0905]|nr:hypothetical protein CJ197_14660 [Brachybacterium sp. UMB0905]
MMESGDQLTETVLLLAVPAAEPVVRQHRRELDRSAADGIPAHLTVVYPFKPLEEISEADHERLARIGREHVCLHVEGIRTAWFGDQVLFVEVKAPEEVHALTLDVASAFPEHPPYSGDVPLAQIVPHLTVGAGAPVAALRTAARAVDGALPFSQEVRAMELWAGPPVEGRAQPARWSRVRSYALGS